VGLNILFFLIVAGGLLVWRWRGIPTEEGKEPFFSRTVFVVLGVVLLVLIGLTVSLGTSAPLISKLWGEPAQVSATFYNRTGFWLAILLAVAMGVGPFLSWRRAGEHAGRRLAISLAVAAAVVVAGALVLGPALGWSAALAAVDVKLAVVRAVVYCLAALLAVVANLWAAIEAARHGRWRATAAPVAHVGLGSCCSRS